jgi:hypothetical protein
MSGWLFVDAGTESARLSVCAACPNYRRGVCSACGCYMPLKAKLRAAECPVGKWPAGANRSLDTTRTTV